MKSFVAITDSDWFELLSSFADPEEVNFWQPGGRRVFGTLKAGELFLFKLHSPQNYIVGGGIFAHATLLPVSLAWKAFGTKNGARSLEEMRTRIEKYRKQSGDRFEDYTIGCIILEQPFFLPESRWIPVPSDWKIRTQVGKTYDLEVEPGISLWRDLQLALEKNLPVAAEVHPRYGQEISVYPRLGQGTFRIMVTDAYDRRCAVTLERTLPVLEAAHIKPYAIGGEHRLDNGLLLRSDIHTLFDIGYLTVTPEYKLEVSRRIHDDFDNGKNYYTFHGERVHVPEDPDKRPASGFLAWHNQVKYLG